MNNNQILEKFRDGQAIDTWYSYDDIITVMNMLREQLTEETVKEYFAGLSGKETALIVLNYLLRGGITDDDLRGLRLQWIKEGVKVWVSVNETNGVCCAWEHRPQSLGNAWIDLSGKGKVTGLSHIEYDMRKLLNLKPGQCKQFLITEVQP